MRTAPTRTRPAVPGRANRSPRRRLGALASIALVAGMATACGGDGDDEPEAEETVTVTAGAEESETTDEDGEGGTPLTEAQLQEVVLSADNLGEGWTGGPSDEEDETDEGPGCLGDIDEITESVEEAEEVDVTYGYGEVGLPQVESGASTFDDEATIATAFDDVQAALTTCTTVQGTDDEGSTYDLTLVADETTSDDALDDQINLTGSGSVTDSSGNDFQISLHLTMARLGTTVVTIGTTDFSDQSAAHEVYAQIGIDRLVAVSSGQTPPATVAPAP